MATHTSILAWEIPWTEETGRLWSMGLQALDTTEQLKNEKNKNIQENEEPGLAFFVGRPCLLNLLFHYTLFCGHIHQCCRENRSYRCVTWTSRPRDAKSVAISICILPKE